MLGSCTSSSQPQKATITVSIEPQRWMLERIVGDRINVNTILASNSDPENFEPSFSNMKMLEQSICYMKMGNFGFERALVERIHTNHPHIAIVNTSDSVPLIVEHNHEHCPGGHEHGVDPHVWNSAKNAKIIARNMYESVIKLDSIHSDYYKHNYNLLLQRIDSVDSICSHLLHHAKGNAFVVWHPSLSYFANDYELEQIAIGADGKELSINDTRHVINHIKEHDATVFLVENNSDAARAQVIAAEMPNIRISTICPLSYDWDNELIQTATAIAEN